MGGTSPRLGVESPVSAETEGEFGRERDPGCTSENGVSIFRSYFPGDRAPGQRKGVWHRGARGEAADGRLFIFSFNRAFTLINEGQAPVAECLWLWLVSFTSG